MKAIVRVENVGIHFGCYGVLTSERGEKWSGEVRPYGMNSVAYADAEQEAQRRGLEIVDAFPAAPKVVKARAQAFRGFGVRNHTFEVEGDGTVRVWDEIANHFTLCHSLSPKAQKRIRRLAEEGDHALR